MKRTSPRCEGSTTDTPGTANTGTPLQGGQIKGCYHLSNKTRLGKAEKVVSMVFNKLLMAWEQGGPVGMQRFSHSPRAQHQHLKGSDGDLPGWAPRSCCACRTCAAHAFASQRRLQPIERPA